MSAVGIGNVFDIQRFSLHDGPGIRTTVFFKGCPLSCWWCHNPESQATAAELMWRDSRCIGCGACVAACAQGAIAWQGDEPVTDRQKCTLCGACADACYAEAREMVGRQMTVEQLMAEIERDVLFFDESGGGVTFSGGEPLLQRAVLGALLRECKANEIHTAVDTCGFATWEAIDGLREWVDLFLYDLKLMDDTKHRAYTGVSNVLILENLRALSRHGNSILLRVPIIPGVNDDVENLQQIGAFAAALPHLVGVDVLPYHHTAVDKYRRLDMVYGLPELRPPSNGVMEHVAEALREYGLRVKIGS